MGFSFLEPRGLSPLRGRCADVGTLPGMHHGVSGSVYPGVYQVVYTRHTTLGVYYLPTWCVLPAHPGYVHP